MPKSYRTQQIWIKPGHRLFPYFQKMCHDAKNLYNTTNFYIRQVFTGLRSDKRLHPLQMEVLDTITEQLPAMNRIQEAAYQKRLQRSIAKAKEQNTAPKEIKCNLFVLPTAEKPYLTYSFLDCLFKVMGQTDYRNLPAHTGQWVIRNAFQNWKSFFASLKEYHLAPDKFNGRPRIPRYCRNNQKELTISNQESSIKDGKYFKLPKTKTRLNIGKLGMCKGKLMQVRIIPKYDRYIVELVFELPESDAKDDIQSNKYMAIDLGVNNLATIVTNTGLTPLLVKGKRLKSLNRYYNKVKAELTSILRHGKEPHEGQHTSKRLERLHRKRHCKVKDILHKASFHIVQLAVKEGIGTIIIGHNSGWKKDINIGKRNNQSFCHIPHSMLINMLTYKAEGYGIQVVVKEESYTSKASFLDNDHLPVYKKNDNNKHIFSGKRVKRGLYCSGKGLLINADVNGAANILRKVVPNALADGIEGLFVSTPLVLSVR